MSYENARIAVNNIILSIQNNKLRVILSKREKDPDKGKLELPGGLLLPNEDAETATKRKLNEMVGTDNVFFEQFHTYTKPNRDPRVRTVSIAYVSLIHIDDVSKQNDWFDVNKKDLAFDHEVMIADARVYLKNNANSDILKHFMPKKFPLNKLQTVYELLEQTTYDNRNFRKKMISSRVVQETNELETNVSHRPAKLFIFKE